MTVHLLEEEPRPYPPAAAPDDLEEATLTALWLLGRVPAEVLPWPLLRPGRAGRGPGPDVREAAFALPSGVVRASDFVAHGHATDPAYAGVVLHLLWEDDRPPAQHGTLTPLPGGGEAVTVALRPLLRDPARVRALVALGPAGAEPCADAPGELGAAEVAARVRAEGRRRLAERTWRAWRLADQYGWEGAWSRLLDRALAGSAGRRAESAEARTILAASLAERLGPDPLTVLATLARTGAPAVLIGALQGGGPEQTGLGRARAAEVGWNAALPLLAALAAAYDDVDLARATARLAESWPAPRPYGRTRALQRLLGRPPSGAGALHAQGLLHLQDLWCSRGGCGACVLSIALTDDDRRGLARREGQWLPPLGAEGVAAELA